jgi:hypothetical protein
VQPSRIVIQSQNKAGSIQHYFHFLLGYLVPFIEYYVSIDRDRDSQVVLQSVGLLDEHTRSLSLSGVVIADQRAYRESVEGTSSETRAPHTQEIVRLDGYDAPGYYRKEAFATASFAMIGMWKQLWAESLSWAASKYANNTSRILFIRRLPPAPFYLTRQCEARGAGTSRRSIANHEVLLGAIRSEFGGCCDASLEEMPLIQQAALFATADIIIAQHGAALANCIWGRSNTCVIEIIPENFDNGKRFRDYFSPLCKELGLRHLSVNQEHSHSVVKSADLIDAIYEGTNKHKC